MGFDTALFVQQPIDDNFLCSICHSVQEKPTVVCDHSHTFCLACIESWIRDGKTECPVCRACMHQKKLLNRPLQGIIMGMKICCPATREGTTQKENEKPDSKGGDLKTEKQGSGEDPPSKRARARTNDKEDSVKLCGWEGTLGDFLDIHCVKECKYAKKACSVCSAMVPVAGMEVHQKSSCPCRKVNCKNCNETIQAFLLSTHQDHNCGEVEVNCPHCSNKVRRKNFGTLTWCNTGGCAKYTGHLAECKELEVQCAFASHGCRATLKRREMENHFKSHILEHSLMLSSGLKQLQEERREEVSIAWNIPMALTSNLYNPCHPTVDIKSAMIPIGNQSVFLQLETDSNRLVCLKVCVQNPRCDIQVSGLRVKNLLDLTLASHPALALGHDPTFSGCFVVSTQPLRLSNRVDQYSVERLWRDSLGGGVTLEVSFTLIFGKPVQLQVGCQF